MITLHSLNQLHQYVRSTLGKKASSSTRCPLPGRKEPKTDQDMKEVKVNPS